MALIDECRTLLSELDGLASNCLMSGDLSCVSAVRGAQAKLAGAINTLSNQDVMAALPNGNDRTAVENMIAAMNADAGKIASSAANVRNTVSFVTGVVDVVNNLAGGAFAAAGRAAIGAAALL